jgi:heme/copper-type cytochrome/quinol oxidase subunit 2
MVDGDIALESLGPAEVEEDDSIMGIFIMMIAYPVVVVVVIVTIVCFANGKEPAKNP